MAAHKLGPCVRCFDDHPADVTVRVMVGSDVYALNLCSAQATKLQAEQMKWARYGTPVMPDPPRIGADTRPKLPRARIKEKPVQIGLPINFERWGITEHAQERLAQRGVTEAQVLWCAEFPDTKLPGRTPDTMVYKQGQVQIVVNPFRHEILTVIDRNKRTEESNAPA